MEQKVAERNKLFLKSDNAPNPLATDTTNLNKTNKNNKHGFIFSRCKR